MVLVVSVRCSEHCYWSKTDDNGNDDLSRRELVVLFRKVALTVVAMFNTVHVERGWWVLSLIQMSGTCICHAPHTLD